MTVTVTPIPIPWGAGASSTYVSQIPTPSQQQSQPGEASYTDGFPPLTMTPLASGGTWPQGKDFNGILQDVTAVIGAGLPAAYSSAFSQAIGGYPVGSVLQSSTSGLMWINTVAGNTTNPDSSSASGWVYLTSQLIAFSQFQGVASIGGTNSISGRVPFGARRAFVEAAASGGAGGSGNTGGGGGGSGGAGARGWIGPWNVPGFASGAALSGYVGNGASTNASGTGGNAPGNTVFNIANTEVAGLTSGSNGSLGGSAIAAGSTSLGSVVQIANGLQGYGGEVGGSGISVGQLLIGGKGGSSMFGPGGQMQLTPNTANAAANGNGGSFYGTGGSGATGSGTGAGGQGGVVNVWWFS